MHRPKLIKRKNFWYLIDDSVPIYEGAAAMYQNTIPVFTSFVDDKLKLCSIGILDNSVPFEDLTAIMGSSNPNDNTPMIDMEQVYNKFVEIFVFDTIGGDFGVNYPDEHDSVMGYYKTHEEAIKTIREYIEKKYFNVLNKSEYDADYTIGFQDGKQIAYLLNGHVNILRIKSIKKSN